MKKVTKLFGLLMIGVLIGFPLKVSLVRAEDGRGGDNQEINNKDSNDQGDNNNNDGENEDGQSNDEQGVFSFVSADVQKAPAVNLPALDEKTILTYADVVNVLKSYETAVSQISANAGVDTGTSNLSAVEKALLNGLLNKHHNQFDRLNNRVAEVNAQLKQLEDLLTPLGTQPISSLFGIKDLLIGELNNFRDIISGISEFDNLNLELLQDETD